MHFVPRIESVVSAAHIALRIELTLHAGQNARAPAPRIESTLYAGTSLVYNPYMTARGVSRNKIVYASTHFSYSFLVFRRKSVQCVNRTCGPEWYREWVSMGSPCHGVCEVCARVGGHRVVIIFEDVVHIRVIHIELANTLCAWKEKNALQLSVLQVVFPEALVQLFQNVLLPHAWVASLPERFPHLFRLCC
jgi:hypothetical protein